MAGNTALAGAIQSGSATPPAGVNPSSSLQSVVAGGAVNDLVAGFIGNTTVANGVLSTGSNTERDALSAVNGAAPANEATNLNADSVLNRTQPQSDLGKV